MNSVDWMEGCRAVFVFIWILFECKIDRIIACFAMKVFEKKRVI